MLCDWFRTHETPLKSLRLVTGGTTEHTVHWVLGYVLSDYCIHLLAVCVLAFLPNPKCLISGLKKEHKFPCLQPTSAYVAGCSTCCLIYGLAPTVGNTCENCNLIINLRTSKWPAWMCVEFPVGLLNLNQARRLSDVPAKFWESTASIWLLFTGTAHYMCYTVCESSSL